MSAPGWHPEDIAAAIRKRGVTLTGLALRYGLNSAAVRHCLGKPHGQAEAVVARFLDVPAAELWPDRYDAKGRRLQPQPGGYVIPETRRRARSNAVSA